MKNVISSVMTRLRQSPRFDWLLLGGGLATYAALTLNKITASSIWFDEAFGAYLVRFDFLEIARYTATDVHPPLYYWFLKIWTELFGTSELAFRSMSLMFGMVAIVFGFLLVRRLFGRKAAWISLLLVVMSPMLIRYGQEARMYTMATAIALAATYVLTFAVKSKRRLPWVIYGVLISLGMWTHYFTALVWLSHWAWRFMVKWQSGKRGKELRLSFFDKNWMFSHILAVALFVPWAIIMLVQFVIVQAGFWIGPVSINTFPNYLANVLYYLESDQTLGLYGTAAVIVVALLIAFGISTYKRLNRADRRNYMLIAAIAFLPVVLLFLLSTPPARPLFVERYLVPAAASFSLFAGVTLALGFKKMDNQIWRVLSVGAVAICMFFGILNVYHYGNFNRTSDTKVMTREVVQKAQSLAAEGEPIIAADPWVFYEAIFYSTDRNPVYLLESTLTDPYGSLDMLKHNDQFKIKDLEAFTQEHPRVWYVGYSADKPLTPPGPDWKELQNFSAFDQVIYKDPYKAAEYQTN